MAVNCGLIPTSKLMRNCHKAEGLRRGGHNTGMPITMRCTLGGSPGIPSAASEMIRSRTLVRTERGGEKAFSEDLKTELIWSWFEARGSRGRGEEGLEDPGELRRARRGRPAILGCLGLLAFPLAFPWTPWTVSNHLKMSSASKRGKPEEVNIFEKVSLL